MTHPYQKPNTEVCAICGVGELDHYYKCPRCGLVGNGMLPEEHVCINKKEEKK